MANIKISELNSIVEKDYTDLLPIVDTSANETKKISIEKLIDNNVELLDVTDTAPSECSTGDKYYNTEDNLIYTAVDTDTWSSTGDQPKSGVFYIVFSKQSNYVYDGTTLISVGGGSGSSDIVMVNEEPTEDTKLYIEDDDLEPQGLPIANSYNTANNMAYSCDYANNAVLKFGKKLWSGSFTSGSITVEGLSNYNIIVVILAAGIVCVGSRTWGGGIIGNFSSYAGTMYNYRFGGSGDTITIDSDNKGGSDGTQNVAVISIYGIF